MYSPTSPASGIAILLFETTLILRQGPIEMMEQHPVEDGPLRRSRMTDSPIAGK